MIQSCMSIKRSGVFSLTAIACCSVSTFLLLRQKSRASTLAIQRHTKHEVVLVHLYSFQSIPL
jgi:hypothetical protein